MHCPRLFLELVEALRVQALVALRQGQGFGEAVLSFRPASLAQRTCYPWGEARVLRVCGEVRAQKGEPDLARQKLEAALAILQRLGPARTPRR